jgi:DnaJ-class molecular chaperone
MAPDNQDNDTKLDLDTPFVEEEGLVEEAPSEVTEPTTVEKKTEDTVSEPSVETVASEDSAAEEQVLTQPTGPDESFNCEPCQGSGLIVDQTAPDGKICSQCGGTGRNK